MSVLDTQYPNLLDWANHFGPDGKEAKVADILMQTNEVMPYIVFGEGNLPTGNKSFVQTGYPEPTWRKMYGYTQPTKGSQAAVTDNCGMLDDYAEVDKKQYELNGSSDAWRIRQDKVHLIGMNQKFMRYFLYGNEATEPEAITGLAPRFNSTTAANGDNIIVGDGLIGDTGALTSIWLVCFGLDTVFCPFPKGSKAGIQIENLGQQTKTNSEGGMMEVLRSHYTWDVGLSVIDWRYIIRIPNIKVSALTHNAASGAALLRLMTRASEYLPEAPMGKPVFMMNKKVRAFLREQKIAAVAGSTLTTETVAGKRVTMFDEIPVCRCDAILNTEAFVG